MRNGTWLALCALLAGCAGTPDPDPRGSAGGGGGKEDSASAPDGPFFDVIFSPQAQEQSHNARIAAIIRQLVQRIDTEAGGDGSGHSIDIAMYSFSDAGIKVALQQAVQRGVSVRMIFEPARADASSPAGTKSAQYEDIGIDIRYINKIMHHKFAIIDGPRQDAAKAETAILITGSGNWSNGAATRYDENTAFMRGRPEQILRFQREFNHLWHNSRDLVWGQTDTYFESMEITDGMIDAVDSDEMDVAFTSANFTVSSTKQGPSFRVIADRNSVADTLVSLIESAEHSIYVASGHLRSRAVSEALVRWHERHPDGDLRIYLDGQEYLSSWYHQDQLADLDECVDAASSAARRQRCMDKGFLFSYQVHSAGVPLRYKFYAYRWDNGYADQMHHKYFIFDEQILASGSYNLSDNAEHDTMENMVIYRDAAIAQTYVRNFEALWITGEGEGRLEGLYDQINGEGDIPLVFPPMALDWDQITALKEALLEACPALDSDEYKRNATAHRTCPRD